MHKVSLSTKSQSTRLKVFNLELFDEHYYIKRDTIVEKITFDNRTFYAKFERINEPLTPLLLEQHLSKQHIIAAPLVKNGHTNYLAIEYKGDEPERFYHLCKHLFSTLNITDYHIYQGRNADKIQVFLEVDNLSTKEAQERLAPISDALKQRITKQWRCLPSTSLPEDYNIVILPYKLLD